MATPYVAHVQVADHDSDVDLEEISTSSMYFPPSEPKSSSLGGSWGVTAIGRGLDWIPPERSTINITPLSTSVLDSVDINDGQAIRKSVDNFGQKRNNPHQHLPPNTSPTSNPPVPIMQADLSNDSETASTTSLGQASEDPLLDSIPSLTGKALSLSDSPPPSPLPSSTDIPTPSSHSTVRLRAWSRPPMPPVRSPSTPSLANTPTPPTLTRQNTVGALSSLLTMTTCSSPAPPKSPRLTRSRLSQKRISLVAGRPVAGHGLVGYEPEDNEGSIVSEEWLSFGGGRASRRITPGGSGYNSPRPDTVPHSDDDASPEGRHDNRRGRSLAESPYALSESSASPHNSPPDVSYIDSALRKSIDRLGITDKPHPPTPLKAVTRGSFSSIGRGSSAFQVTDGEAVASPASIHPPSKLTPGLVLPSSEQVPIVPPDEEPAPEYLPLDAPNPTFSLARLSSSWSVASSMAAKDGESNSPSTDLKVGSLSRSVSTRSVGGLRGGYLGGKSIDDYVILGELGRGAYGLVKRAKERKKPVVEVDEQGQETIIQDVEPDETTGPPLIIKQIIKSRILADCWKKHPVHGTIPIEIFVMSAISGTSYILPNRRAWDPRRYEYWALEDENKEKAMNGDTNPAVQAVNKEESIENENPLEHWRWEAGDLIKGHPNICPLEEFFEDAHYYYLVLPATKPSPPSFPVVKIDDPRIKVPMQTKLIDGKEHLVLAGGDNVVVDLKEVGTPNDLFDLVEVYPSGLPAPLIRSFLGQIADALTFLHARGICHRDIKDENVVLGEHGRCWLIDFGSSGVVRRNGWDSFSGTLDYAAPEILQGERYAGPPQDVWAFGIVAYVLLTGECPFASAAEAACGLVDPDTKPALALRERCCGGPNEVNEGLERDGGGRLGDAMVMVLRCLDLNPANRPTMDEVLVCRYLSGGEGWGLDEE